MKFERCLALTHVGMNYLYGDVT